MIFDYPDFSVQSIGCKVDVDSLFIHFSHGKILMHKTNHSFSLPRWDQIKPYLDNPFIPFELAHIGTTAIISPAPHTHFAFPENDNLSYVDFNIFRSLPVDTASIMAACRHLWSWYQNNRYCGNCAAALIPDQQERALNCPRCGNIIFPSMAPAVIVAITCNDRILLARNLRYQHYALIAGYVEVGETLEHALRREVQEEVGLTIHDIRYLGDQPWGVSGSHMFAFHAKADDQQPLRIQKTELADAKWFDRADVQPLPHKLSIAHELIERFRNNTL